MRAHGENLFPGDSRCAPCTTTGRFGDGWAGASLDENVVPFTGSQIRPAKSPFLHPMNPQPLHPLSLVLLSMMPFSHLHGATWASFAAGESTVYRIDSSDLVGPAPSGSSALGGSGIVCVNHFNIREKFSTITDVTVQWSLMFGTSYFTAGIWSDPNQDGNPSDAVLLATSALTPAVAGVEVQQVQFPSPLYVGPEGTSFFVGVYWQESAQERVDLFMGRDRPLEGQTESWSKTFLDTPPDPSNLSGATVNLSTRRAWVIRPTGVVPEPSIGLWFATAAWSLTWRRRTKRSGEFGRIR